MILACERDTHVFVCVHVCYRPQVQMPKRCQFDVGWWSWLVVQKNRDLSSDEASSGKTTGKDIVR